MVLVNILSPSYLFLRCLRSNTTLCMLELKRLYIFICRGRMLYSDMLTSGLTKKRHGSTGIVLAVVYVCTLTHIFSQLSVRVAAPLDHPTSEYERHATALALETIRHSKSDPWISLWRKAKGRSLASACVPRRSNVEEERQFLSRNSVFEISPSNKSLCTVTNGYEFALRWRLDEVQHPRRGEQREQNVRLLLQFNSTDPFPERPDVKKWNSTVAAARFAAPSCHYAGSIRANIGIGWGGHW